MTTKYERIATLTNQTALIVARHAGQTIILGSQVATATKPSEALGLYGTGVLYASTGDWDLLTIVEGTHPDLMPFTGSSESTINAESLDVQRRIGDGPWITIATDLPVDGAVIDPLPSLKDPNRYRAITKTSLPTSAEGSETEIVWEPPFGGTHIYLNGGPNFGTVCHASGHIASEAPTLNSVLHHFGTSPHPVVYYGTERSDRITFTANLVDDSTPREEWLALSVQPYIVCYRDRRGRRTFGRLSLTANDAGGVVTISGTVDATHWEEGPEE